MREMPRTEKEIQEAEEILRQFSEDKELKEMKELTERFYREWYTDPRVGVALGTAMGMRSGIELIAKRMLEENIDISLISKITELTEEQIKTL